MMGVVMEYWEGVDCKVCPLYMMRQYANMED